MGRRLLALTAVLFFAGGAAARAETPLAAEETVSAGQVRFLMELKPGLIVFDARAKSDFDALHVKGARLPMDREFYTDMELYKSGIVPEPPNVQTRLRQAMKDVPRTTPLITYCNVNCDASAQLLRSLKELGFNDVLAMKPGFEVWVQAGYPVEGSEASASPNNPPKAPA